MDIIDGTGFWIIGDGAPVPPVPPTPPPAVVPPFAGAGPIRTLYRQGTVPNDLAVILMVLADD